MSEPDYWQKNGLIKPDPWIVCAANRNKDSGRIICGARHWDQVMRSQLTEPFREPHFRWEQGFLTQFSEWVSREEAWTIAEKNGQIKRITGTKGTLYSEDLW
jgi:hypothetical protein